MKCRFDNLPINEVFVDLGFSPPSNAYLTPSQLNEPEAYYPLKLYVNERNFLVQIDEYKKASDIFDSDYAYFSSYSTSWLAHSKKYVEMILERFGFTPEYLVIEVASNDGYLLQYFQEKNVPVLGIEPTLSTAKIARAKGIESITEFFGVALATDLRDAGRQADLLLGNNVLAHVPDINDFVGGLKIALKPKGIITMEFPHLMQLVEQNQFDTIYHEHFSYFSFHTVKQIFAVHGLKMFDVEEISTHGGSLRIFACHDDHDDLSAEPRVKALLDKEKAAGMLQMSYYQGFQEKVNRVKNDFSTFLLEQAKLDKKVGAYGAAAKGNTLLNYCGVKPDLLPWVVDASPHKQNKYLPGSHIPVLSEEIIKEEKPDYIIILPWNIKAEISEQLKYIRDWGGAICGGHTNIKYLVVMGKIPINKPSITDLEISYVQDAIANGWGAKCYDYIFGFQDQFANYQNSKYALATSSCTGAIHLALMALGVKAGDEVILPEATWIASAEPVLYIGAKPVFVDIKSDTWCINPAKIEEAITEKTKAIIAVHLYGNVCEMDEIMSIAKEHNLVVLEDAAEGLGSEYKGKKCGSIGHVGVFSFHGTKTMSTGEGGILVTDDEEVFEKAKVLNDHGRNPKDPQHQVFWMRDYGYKYKMSNLQAAMGCAQVERLDELVSRKRQIFDTYHKNLKGLPLQLNVEQAYALNSYWLPTVVFDESISFDREEFFAKSREVGIDTRPFFLPLSSLPMFPSVEENTVAYSIHEKAVNLPSFHEITQDEIGRVSDLVKSFCS